MFVLLSLVGLFGCMHMRPEISNVNDTEYTDHGH